ncbi:flagellar hook-associated protein 3 FlgL [Sphingomonas sp. NFR04]|uniref:flagellin n=1 Tax=Sphingomonas sp. NFR04 TaxID=1566283 RepID=UPI0008EE946B|nr:flagellin [Sphingomonas sp. NFR04]SFK43788.1 flagellar hook-associated protein 3 FlgL [Sphingomonas sp. NFR04]
MTRVATIPLQRTMAGAISSAQEKLAITQKQLSTGKKATDFASLGTEAVRNLSAHTLLEQQKAQSNVAKRVGTTMSLYQGHIEGVQTANTDLRKQILTAIGTGQSAGLQQAMESAFSQMRSSLNATEGGVPLFGGSQTDSAPFSVATLADAATVPADQAFHDDNVLATARVADGLDVQYGVNASSFGSGLYDAYRAMAQIGPIGDKLTDAQVTALQGVVTKMDAGLKQLNAVNADNGRKQSQIEDLTARGEDRSLLLQQVIEDNEDADLGQVAIDLSQQKTVLEASYSVFSQLSSLSLVKYL